MVAYINATPHAICLNDGRTFAPSGEIARVSATFSNFTGDTCEQTFGEVSGLPPSKDGVRIIVSAMILTALAGSRQDVVAPATGHPDVVRNSAGHIISVPGFVN